MNWVEPFLSGPQGAKEFSGLIEARQWAIVQASATGIEWAIFGPDHDLEEIVSAEK